MHVSCFLPCRKGSERVPKKNIKPFAGYDYGLVEIKLKQLISTRFIDEVVLSTNDEEILDYAVGLNSSKVRVHRRIDALSLSSTSTDELIAHAAELIPDAHILWTHVTSPFVTAEDYDQIIHKYFWSLENGYDSLMTTTLIHGFLWNDKGPINYDRKKEKWPRTQTLSALHEINSAAFISSSESYKRLDDRIGNIPFLYELEKIKSFDIDWLQDFELAEIIAQSGRVDL